MSLSEADFREEPLDEASAPEPPSPAERLSAPEALTPDDRKGWAIALIAAAALHLIIPLALIVYYTLWPPAVPVAVQEIPVEVVVEQPPPKPNKAEDKPKPPPEPDDEKPAYDAPAPATEEKINRESPDKTTQAPAAATAPSPTPGAPPKTDAQTPPPPHDLTPTPEGEQPADLNPATDENTADASDPAAPAPPAKAPAGAPLPTIEDAAAIQVRARGEGFADRDRERRQPIFHDRLRHDPFTLSRAFRAAPNPGRRHRFRG